jgi:hypothetical protein
MLDTIRESLAAPFPVQLVTFLPVDIRAEPDGTATCTALPIVDCDHYRARLDALAFGSWSDSVVAIVAAGGRLTVAATVTIGSITHTGVGDASLSAAAPIFLAHPQAFRRACRSFGLGAYLWQLIAPRARYDPERKTLVSPPLRVAVALYERADLPVILDDEERSVVAPAARAALPSLAVPPALASAPAGSEAAPPAAAARARVAQVTAHVVRRAASSKETTS